MAASSGDLYWSTACSTFAHPDRINITPLNADEARASERRTSKSLELEGRDGIFLVYQIYRRHRVGLV